MFGVRDRDEGRVRRLLREAALRALWFAFVYLLGNTVSTTVQVPFLAMPAELTTECDERSSITGIRMTVSLLSSIACAALPTPAIVTAARFPLDGRRHALLVRHLDAVRSGGIPDDATEAQLADWAQDWI